MVGRILCREEPLPQLEVVDGTFGHVGPKSQPSFEGMPPIKEAVTRDRSGASSTTDSVFTVYGVEGADRVGHGTDASRRSVLTS